MNWKEVCEHQALQNLPFKIELNKELYFSMGAKEVWICYKTGNLRFFLPGEEIEKSNLFPNFPKKIDY